MLGWCMSHTIYMGRSIDLIMVHRAPMKSDYRRGGAWISHVAFLFASVPHAPKFESVWLHFRPPDSSTWFTKCWQSLLATFFPKLATMIFAQFHVWQLYSSRVLWFFFDFYDILWGQNLIWSSIFRRKSEATLFCLRILFFELVWSLEVCLS